ncbi:MAG: 5-formyltetrahydrofolate cyclo-ligase [Gemmatimonadetes bacterium]|nr:5-formyltetrahydrofolate cyclo-ligase [Gemmatimonadota bacterium]
MSKTTARAEARVRLRSISPADRTIAGERIADRVWAVPEVSAARTLLLYASLPEEVTTDPIADEALRRGITITYPRCLPETRMMTLHVLQERGELREAGSYGIREPDLACPTLELADIDVILVPGLAWDRNGGRLGRGAGYYDRLFSNPDCRAFRCGLFFAAQELARIPLDPWDVTLDAVVTEKELISYK